MVVSTNLREGKPMVMKKILLLATLCFALLTGTAMDAAAERPFRIAFVDTGNTGRSITSEALAIALITRGRANIQVISRAVDLNPYNIHPEANFVTLLKPRGIDISGHVAAPFAAPDAKYSDLILTMTLAHKKAVLVQFPTTKGKVFTLSEYVTGTHSDIADAFGKPIEFYTSTLGQLDSLVGAALTKAATPK